MGTGTGGAVLGEPKASGEKPEGGGRGIVVAGIEGGNLATLGLVGGRASLPRAGGLRPDPLLSKRVRGVSIPVGTIGTTLP